MCGCACGDTSNDHIGIKPTDINVYVKLNTHPLAHNSDTHACSSLPSCLITANTLREGLGSPSRWPWTAYHLSEGSYTDRDGYNVLTV